MTLNNAVAIRIREILKSKNMTQYRLEHIACVPHSTMSCIMSGRNKASNLNTIVIIIRGLGMTVAEFFDDPIFENEDLEIY